MHPLCGERLAAISFQRRSGELLLVVVLPDGTPGMIAAAATDVFGERVGTDWDPTALSVDGVRRLRALIDTHRDKLTTRRRARPWKVVRHKRGIEPFHRVVRVYSAHTTESAARRSRDKEKAAMIRSSGYDEAAKWEWSVVHDPAGLLGVSAPRAAQTSQEDQR